MSVGVALRISRIVKRADVTDRAGRVRYEEDGAALIPEQVVLRRWKAKSNEIRARAEGTRYDGCRLPSGTWRLLDEWLSRGLSLQGALDPTVLERCIVCNRESGSKLRTPPAPKLAHLVACLHRKGALDRILRKERAATSPGIPDLFLYRIDARGKVCGAHFVEVKRQTREPRWRERISEAQLAEIEFLRGLGLSAGVVYLIER